MGIESLNSAVAAAGFAMVSEESMDVTESAMFEVTESLSAASTGKALALLDGPSRAPASVAQAFGERVTGLLDVFRPKG